MTTIKDILGLVAARLAAVGPDDVELALRMLANNDDDENGETVLAELPPDLVNVLAVGTAARRKYNAALESLDEVRLGKNGVLTSTMLEKSVGDTARELFWLGVRLEMARRGIDVVENASGLAIASGPRIVKMKPDSLPNVSALLRGLIGG